MPPEYWSTCAGLRLVHTAQGRSHPTGPRPWLDLAIETGRRHCFQWNSVAEIRRMRSVERLSQREIHRRTGIHRDTIRKALASPKPPSYGPRARRASKLDPYRSEIERLLSEEPALSGV